MTERKYAHGRPAPSLTPDRDEAKCHVRPEWFDELVQPKADPEVVEAIKHTCDACPLQVACWAENAGREWLDVLTGVKALRVPKRKTKRSLAWAARAAERIAVMEKHAAEGSSVEDVAAALGITPTSVYTWCGRHDALDLFHQFEGSRAVLEARRARHRARQGAAA